MTASPVAIAVDVVSDVVCPWCYIGKRRLEKAMAAMTQTPLSVRWRPFQLDPTIPPGGIPREEYLKRKFGVEKLSQIHLPVITAGALEGIDFQLGQIRRSPNTIDAHRLIRWAHSHGLEEPMVERLFQLYFLEGQDIGDEKVLSRAAADLGFDRTAAATFLASEGGRDEVRQEIESAGRIGVTGVPTFIVANRFAVIGAQDPRYIAGAIAKARAAAADDTGA